MKLIDNPDQVRSYLQQEINTAKGMAAHYQELIAEKQAQASAYNSLRYRLEDILAKLDVDVPEVATDVA
jgi:hypothetical protein